MEWLPPDWCPSVVVIDIDGTITDGKKHLSTEAVAAVGGWKTLVFPWSLRPETSAPSPTDCGVFSVSQHPCAVKTVA